VVNIFSPKTSNGNPEADRQQRRAVDDLVFDKMVNEAHRKHQDGENTNLDVLFDVLKVTFHYQRESDRRVVNVEEAIKSIRQQWRWWFVGASLVAGSGITAAVDPTFLPLP
tara:strand:- start:397 stop:729 length:333 start_codon:yes stop_codon:yes gene_type:complete